MDKKIKNMFFSKKNGIILVAIILVIIALSLVLCTDCFGNNCGYCNGCHTMIDCLTTGLIRGPLELSIILFGLYVVGFGAIYFTKK